jgi:hypothetical protein
MNRNNISKLAESILSQIEKRDSRVKTGFTSLEECFVGMAVMQAAREEIDNQLLLTLESINEMAKSQAIVKGVHFKTKVDSDGDYVLMLNYLSFYDRLISFCRSKNMQQELVTLRDFKTLLRTQKYCKEYNRPVWFDELPSSYVNKKIYRCAVLKIDELKRKNCSIDALIDRRAV